MPGTNSPTNMRMTQSFSDEAELEKMALRHGLSYPMYDDQTELTPDGELADIREDLWK